MAGGSTLFDKDGAAALGPPPGLKMPTSKIADEVQRQLLELSTTDPDAIKRCGGRFEIVEDVDDAGEPTVRIRPKMDGG